MLQPATNLQSGNLLNPVYNAEFKLKRISTLKPDKVTALAVKITPLHELNEPLGSFLVKKAAVRVRKMIRECANSLSDKLGFLQALDKAVKKILDPCSEELELAIK